MVCKRPRSQPYGDRNLKQKYLLCFTIFRGTAHEKRPIIECYGGCAHLMLRSIFVETSTLQGKIWRAHHTTIAVDFVIEFYLGNNFTPIIHHSIRYFMVVSQWNIRVYRVTAHTNQGWHYGLQTSAVPTLWRP